MKNLFTFLLVSLLATTFAIASPYTIDDTTVDQLFASATEVSTPDLALTASTVELAAPTAEQAPLAATTMVKGSDNKVLIGFILCITLGYLGIHRFYLGTKPLTGIAYILTGGGCGILVAVDWILLIIELIEDGNGAKYIDNPKFFMWSN